MSISNFLLPRRSLFTYKRISAILTTYVQSKCKMASTFFENIGYYRDLISRSTRKSTDVKSTPALTNEASDTTICARIRPLSGDESEAHHISGLVNTGLSSTTLFEPRKKFNGSPDATVSPSSCCFQPRKCSY